MFTGIVGALGRVVETEPGRLVVAQSKLASRLEVGGSVAVNGACLTVTEARAGAFAADVVPETERRTNIGLLRGGDYVNLELPLTAAQALDGHLVQGHVDGTSRVRATREVEVGRELVLDLPRHLAAFVAEKGSIALDGASLTVAEVDDGAGTFTVALIPHTLEHTVAGAYALGAVCNLEVDLVARYVGRLLRVGD